MKILWLTNIPLPESSLLLNEKPMPYGGWLVNASKQLSENDFCELAIAFPKDNIDNYKLLYGETIKYYLFPRIKNRDKSSIGNNVHLTRIIDEVKPDIVHIFGTEYEHTLEMINICKERSIEAVISVQGLVSVIAKHYTSSLPVNVQRRFTFRDFVKQDSINQQQKKFSKRGNEEIESIKRAQHIIGRTTWDKACISEINPNAQYHFCNETLREEFYKYRWSIEKCEKHSIFVSQGSYPIKGLHFVLEAMRLVLRRFPDAKLYIAGDNIVKSDTLKDKLKKSSYGKYIEKLIQQYDLKNTVFFTGSLNEIKMCQQYLKSHVFVCPSSIENSPNSLGEAMILGIPSVASYVGGIPDMLKDKQEGFLYQHDAPYMLAHYVCEIFDNAELAGNFSNNARQHASETHDRDGNIMRLIDIYSEIIGEWR